MAMRFERPSWRSINSKHLETTTFVAIEDGARGETIPLLGLSPSHSYADPHGSRPRLLRSGTFVINVLILLIVIAATADQFFEPPQQRIYEAIICYRYYEVHDPSKILLPRSSVGPGAIGGVEEMYCKVDSVQADLAMLRGYQTFFDGIPSLVMAVPVAWAAERFGRKPILALGVLSVVLRMVWLQIVSWWWQSFDIRLLWLSSLHGFLAGGGGVVLTNLVFLAITDVTPSAERASVFMRVGGFSLVPSIVGPPLTAMWMKLNPWFPSLTGTCLDIVCFLLLLALPETLDFRNDNPDTRVRKDWIDTNADADADVHISTSPDGKPIALKHCLDRLQNAVAFLTDDLRVPAVITVYFGHFLMAGATMFLTQYCSKRYNLTFADATLLTTIMSVFKVAGLLVLVPWLSSLAMRRHQLSAQRKDLIFTRVSFALTAVGWTWIGLSPNIALVSVGMIVSAIGVTGAYALARSFLTSLLAPDQIARAYSIMAICDGLGNMFGSTLMAELFNVGVHRGSAWSGMPFVLLGVLGMISTAIMGLVHLYPHEEKNCVDQVGACEETLSSI